MAPANGPGPSDPLRDRILSAVRSTPSTTRTVASLRGRWLIGTGVALTMIVFFVLGGVRPTGRPLALMLETSGGTAIIAMAALWVVLRWNGMLGRPATDCWP